MTTLDRHKYLIPDETTRLLVLLDREAIVARERGHSLPVRDEMLIRLAIVSGPRTSELHLAPGALVRSGVGVVGFCYQRDFASAVGLSMGIILL